MANENNKIKLLLLWDILSKNTDENHAMNADEIREELAKRGISVMRKVIADDILIKMSTIIIAGIVTEPEVRSVIIKPN